MKNDKKSSKPKHIQQLNDALSKKRLATKIAADPHFKLITSEALPEPKNAVERYLVKNGIQTQEQLEAFVTQEKDKVKHIYNEFCTRVFNLAYLPTEQAWGNRFIEQFPLIGLSLLLFFSFYFPDNLFVILCGVFLLYFTHPEYGVSEQQKLFKAIRVNAANSSKEVALLKEQKRLSKTRKN